jgi:hypothetical protein
MNVYLDEGGARIFTSSGISGGQYWFTAYQKYKGGSIRRLMSNDLPVRSKQAVAQTDLDAFAARCGWKVEGGI